MNIENQQYTIFAMFLFIFFLCVCSLFILSFCGCDVRRSFEYGPRKTKCANIEHIKFNKMHFSIFSLDYGCMTPLCVSIPHTHIPLASFVASNYQWQQQQNGDGTNAMYRNKLWAQNWILKIRHTHTAHIHMPCYLHSRPGKFHKIYTFNSPNQLWLSKNKIETIKY